MKEQIIKFPKNIYSNSTGLNFFSKLFTTEETDMIIFDLTENGWIDANLCSVFSLLIDYVMKETKSRVIIRHKVNEVVTIFKKNGFFKRYGLGEETDSYNSTIPLRIFNTEQEEDFLFHLDEKVMPKINFSQSIDAGVVKSFQTSLSEIFTNVRLHAQSEKVYTCGQLYYNKEKVSFTIANYGVTIGDNVKSLLEKPITDAESIFWAIKDGHTTKRMNDQGGLGFPLARNFIRNNNGKFIIKSGMGILTEEQGEIRYNEYPAFFPGTIVSIETQLIKPIIWSDF